MLMKKIILSESQSKNLAAFLMEENEVQKMPVDKKMNKPYCIDPEKVLVVKKFLDNGYIARDYEKIGPDGFPQKIKIIQMNASNGEPLKYLYKSQMVDLLIDKFQKMFLDKTERELFMKQVLNDWMNDRISVHGLLSVNALNESTVTSDMVDERASETNTEPTEKQKEAGNYKMGHISIKGMQISIETPKGSLRKGKDRDGNEWERVMKNHYGYFTNTTGNGKDGDAVDVFIGPHPDDFERVYVVDQKVDGEFDESKVMIGFYSKAEAKDAYMSNYSADWKGFWKITGVSIKTFKRWLYRERKQRKPFFDYVTIKKQRLEEGKLNEEEYNQIVRVATMFDEKAAQEVSEELNAKGISAYFRGNVVYAEIEQDRLYPYYVDEVTEFARRVAREYMTTHAVQGEPALSLNEEHRLSRLDVEGWRIERREDGKSNLRNDKDGRYASEEWYDWVGFPNNGLSVINDREKGWNLMTLNGKVIFNRWFDDVLETKNDYIYAIVDGPDDYLIDVRKYL